MTRLALSLSLLSMAMVPTAFAEGSRSLGVTVSPVGAFYILSAPPSASTGYSASVGWRMSPLGHGFALAGHATGSALFTEATPAAVRWTAFPEAPVRPFLGVGLSLLVAHPGSPLTTAAPLRFGAEVSAGVEIPLGRSVFALAQGQFQSFSHGPEPFAARRLAVTSAHVGIGLSL